MEFHCSSLGRLFSRASQISLNLGPEVITFVHRGRVFASCAYEEIESLSETSKLVRWSDVSFASAEREYPAVRLTKDQAGRLQVEVTRRIESALARNISAAESSIMQLSQAAEAFLSAKTYLAHREHQLWLEHFVNAPQMAGDPTIKLLRHPLLNISEIEPRFQSGVARLVDLISPNSDCLKDWNIRFVEDALKTHERFFDTLDRFPLTDEQRRAAIIMEDRNLLIAPAGSGKTSALVGKIGYALKTGLCKPDEIVVVAYNSKAREEIQERLTGAIETLGDLSELHVHTFHSLGKTIIADAAQRQPNLAKVAEDDLARDKLIEHLVDELNKIDASFSDDYLTYLLLYSHPVSYTAPSEGDPVEPFAENPASRSDRLRTLGGELVKSNGEKSIADWLYVNQIRYEYERKYEHDMTSSTHTQYRPDFYFPDIDCYLEHYALDKHGAPPPKFGQPYLDGIKWKRELHDKMGTECLETTVHEFESGTLFGKLEKELTNRGIEMRPLSKDALRAKLLERSDPKAFNRLLSVAARHAKSNMLSCEDILGCAEVNAFKARAKVFASLLNAVMVAYENTLRNAGEIDFEDMINLAIKSAEKSQLTSGIKLILVDEFQDISSARARLISALLKQSPDAKLFAVGDDWQSIYRFSGADNSLFRNFSETFGATAISYLTTTFRFNQGIADMASGFVSRNPSQIPKTVKSIDARTQAVAVCFRAETESDESRAFTDILQTISSGHENSSSTTKVFVLARYKFVLNKARRWLGSYAFAGVSIEFSTVHSAKGLEADYVILLDLNGGNFGFPSELEDDPLLQLVMPHPETYPHAEERRLFYVALTRTKNVFYCISNDRNPSTFIYELAKGGADAGALKLLSRTSSPAVGDCPKCHVGVVREREGRYGRFAGCSRYPRCDFTSSRSAV